MVVLAHPDGNFRDVMDAFDDVLWGILLSLQLQGLLVVGSSVLIFTLFEIDRADVVQTNCLRPLIPNVPFQLQRFLVHLQRWIVISSVVVEVSQIEQSVTQTSL